MGKNTSGFQRGWPQYKGQVYGLIRPPPRLWNEMLSGLHVALSDLLA